MQSLAQRSGVEAVDDVARQELELVLGGRGALEVVPLLVDDASTPAAYERLLCRYLVSRAERRMMRNGIVRPGWRRRVRLGEMACEWKADAFAPAE
jgi:hypothetical protein